MASDREDRDGRDGRDGRSSAELGSHLRAIRRAAGVTPTARLVYTELLVEYPDGCWLSKPRLARTLALSKRALDRAVDELVRLGLVDVVGPDEESGVRTNTYSALPPAPGLVEPWRLQKDNKSYRAGRAIDQHTRETLRGFSAGDRALVEALVERQRIWLNETGCSASCIKWQATRLERLCAVVGEVAYRQERRLHYHEEWLLRAARTDIQVVEGPVTISVPDGRAWTIVPIGAPVRAVAATDWLALTVPLTAGLVARGVESSEFVGSSQAAWLVLPPGVALGVRDLLCEFYSYQGPPDLGTGAGP